MKQIAYLLTLAVGLLACNNADRRSQQATSEGEGINLSLVDSVFIDTTKIQLENPDTLNTPSPKAVSTNTIRQERGQKSIQGFSDANLNGETILVQMELSESLLAAHPDTIKNYLKGVYMGQERNFPRSIADNFEQGISTEYISYTKLNYRVELFENEYSRKPYKIIGYSVRKEKENIVVE